MVMAHAVRIRRLPGMSNARAIIAAETNLHHVVPVFFEHLMRAGLDNYVLLHLHKTATASHAGAGQRNLPGFLPGDLAPGILTAQKNKAFALEMLDMALKDGRFFLHRDLVHYTVYDPDEEMRIAAAHGFDEQRIRAAIARGNAGEDVAGANRFLVAPTQRGEVVDDVHRVLEQEDKTRIEALLVKEFKWMKRIVTRTKLADGTDYVRVRFQGKGGRDPDDGRERRDDLVMACVIVFLGALGFYTGDTYAEERQRLGIRG